MNHQCMVQFIYNVSNCVYRTLLFWGSYTRARSIQLHTIDDNTADSNYLQTHEFFTDIIARSLNM